MFIDRARIYVEAGNGGDGMSSFRREKFVEKGGPNGGNGGRGGDVILVADKNLNTLIDFRYKRKYVAKRGGQGGTKNCTGMRADNVYVKVPMGTLVRDDVTGAVMADLTEDGQEYIAAKGGRGGKGNACYVTSTNRAPTFAEKGEPGENRWLKLELKLLADVGLVGYPSVGKSSIIAQVSAARPEIAAYHFTTLSPVLGVVRIDEERSFVLADIPGLIEGAHEGVGLGHDFLRHVERTKVLLHIVDVAGVDGRDPIEDFDKINNELAQYSERLARRKQLVVANKMDLPEAQENFGRLKEYVEAKGYEITKASAATGEGLRELMFQAYELLEAYVPEEDEQELSRFDEIDPDSYEIVVGNDTDYEVRGKNIERLVAMTNFDNDEALYRFQLIWKRLGIDEALKEKGVQEGETVRIRDMVFEYKEN
ncbi:MAG: GTPase ObgE [Phascolarctobacterium sp.]|nr:GTPase ObgE [Phascolarctobacterium sp.]MBQ3113050.1 GTPase ObgE [Phascolarctobacterium sp.]MBQ3540485.1 GTPase ObgE [Phascolarctobacterium sp.]MBQ7021032.1 GTPase ObgE [Phascolarctobacterium sp.]MBR1976056.1 GTPase ObgE [Phascolarctobacterium sp.]